MSPQYINPDLAQFVAPDATLTLDVYDKAYVYQGPVLLRDVDVSWRDRMSGDALVTVDSDHEQVEAMITPGARGVLTYKWSIDAAPIIWSGRFGVNTYEGLGDQAVRTFPLSHDWNAVFKTLLGWVNPADTSANMDNQGADDSIVYSQTGPLEDVAKNIISVNADRSGTNLTVAPSLHRGPTVTVAVRMDRLADKLFPIIAQSGLVFTVEQVGTERVVDCYQSATYPLLIDESSGLIAKAAYTITDATCNSIVIGAGGNGTLRLYRKYLNTASIAELGEPLEDSIDATDLDINAVDLFDQMAQRGAQALAEGATQTSLTVDMVEGEAWRFGDTFQLGDTVTLQFANSGPLTDQVREVNIAGSTDNGLVVTPHVGDWDNTDPDLKTKSDLAAIAKRVRIIERSR